MVIRKVSFYCYLFYKPAGRVERFDILWKTQDKVLMKCAQLNTNLLERSEDIKIKIFPSVEAVIKHIIYILRSQEIKHGVYKNLRSYVELPEVYQPWIEEISFAIFNEDVKSFSMFGQISKYLHQYEPRSFLRQIGYFEVKSHRPHIYLFDDIMQVEISQSH